MFSTILEWLRTLLALPPRGPFLGAWVDVSPSQFTRDLTRHAESVRASGLDELCFVLQSSTRSDHAADWTYGSPQEFQAAVRAARAFGFRRVGAMLWPRPRTDWMETLPAALERCRAIGFDYVELDIEDNWYDRTPRGFADRREAARQLYRIIRRHWRKTVSATTYPDRVRSLAYVLTPADEVAVQAYSQRQYGLTGTYGIPGMQRRGARFVRELDGPRLIVGLAAYAQVYPGITSIEGMHRALAAARDQDPVGIRYWSWKHIYGPRRNDYAARALVTAS